MAKKGTGISLVLRRFSNHPDYIETDVNPNCNISSKRKVKKSTGPDLYSPEYLAKKHGIKIKSESTSQIKEVKSKTKANFGFYSFMLVSIVLAISILRLIYFTQDIIIEKIPILEIYINYLFETIRNIKDIIQNFFSNY